MGSNPIIPGFHPDPTICRVGEDYYLAVSSFEYFPAVPIFRSRDLVTWTQIGNILDRMSQLDLREAIDSGGIFAPTLRHHDGRFWLVTTNQAQMAHGQLIVSAEDPAGPWSDPVFVAGALGVDPDLAWDSGGVCHLTWSTFGDDSTILQASIDPSTGALLSEPRRLWSGTGLAAPEAPHVYQRDGWWYLLIAEGGTARGHAVSVARSRSITGPYEGNPANPIFTHRSTADPVQNTGHADLVELPSGQWAAVYLGVRPRGFAPQFHVNGRETFLAAVRWEDDWPVFDEGHYRVPPADTTFIDEFDGGTLRPQWISRGGDPRAFATLGARGARGARGAFGAEGLALRSPGEEHGGHEFLAVRARDEQWAAEAVIRSGCARLILWLDSWHWARVGRYPEAVRVEVALGEIRHTLAEVPAGPGSTVTLAVRATRAAAEAGRITSPPDRLAFGLMEGSEFRSLAELDGRYLSTEVAGGFTGRVIGIGAAAGGATITRFAYAPLHDNKPPADPATAYGF
jgi:xylan 1,4-beta-xylosidase